MWTYNFPIVYVCLFYRQMMCELLPANLVPLLKPNEWKQVTLFYINSACVQNFFLIFVPIVLIHCVWI